MGRGKRRYARIECLKLLFFFLRLERERKKNAKATWYQRDENRGWKSFCNNNYLSKKNDELFFFCVLPNSKVSPED